MRLSLPRRLLSVLMLLLVCAVARAEPAALNGLWQLDADNSENIEDAGTTLNEKLKEEYRRKGSQKFKRDTYQGGGNKYANAARATEEFIREDGPTYTWALADDCTAIVAGERLKLYVSDKVIVLYGTALRRLLTINPAGRAYSVRGTEFTDDAVGRSLTYTEGDTLIIETELRSGSKLVERFAQGASPDVLVQSLRVQQDSRGPWLEFKRQFTRAGGG